MSRWKYPLELVTVGDNAQNVRKLTAGERKAFALASRDIKAGKMEATELPFLLASFACVEPSLTKVDAEGMPPDLLDACVEKILELSGMRGKEPDEVADPEKKASDSSQTTS